MRAPRRVEGFTLIEILLVLAVVAALVLMAFVIFPRMRASQMANEEMQVISSAQAVIKSNYNTGDFSGLSVGVANLSGFFPKEMQGPTVATLNSRFGPILVSGSTDLAIADAAPPAPYYRIVYYTVPRDVCSRMVANAVNNFDAVFVGSTLPATTVAGAAVKNDFTGVALDEALIASKCNATATVFIAMVAD